MIFDCFYYSFFSFYEVIFKEIIMMKNLYWIQKNFYFYKENFQLNQETEVIKEELLCFKVKGGGVLVENIIIGISRDVKILKWFVEEIGVYIIFGVGFYVDVIYFLEIRVMLVEQVKSFKFFDNICV